MSIKFNDVLKLARAPHTMPVLRSVVFDGKSAMTAAPVDWVVGVPCLQPNLTEPVVVPVDAITAHLLKSRHLIVMPDHLSNGQGLVTPFDKKPNMNWEQILDMLPKVPQGAAASFDLELDALDRVLVAAGEHDIRYYLNGVLMDLSNGMLVGTDGHRLHCYKNRVPMAYKRKRKDGMPVSPVVEVILPRDPLRWITHSASAAARVTIWDAQRDEKKPGQPVPQVLLQADDGFVWVRKSIDGRFPDYARVIPSVLARPVWMQIDPVKLADTMSAMGKLAMLKSGGKFGAVVVDFGKGEVTLDGGAEPMPITVNLASDHEDIDLKSLDDDLWIGVNAPYLQDLADCVTPAAQWRVDHTNCRNQGLLVIDGDFSGVVMPTRIGGPEKVAPVPQDATEAAPAEPVTVDAAPEPAKAPGTAQDAQEEPESAPAEPCPAAVAAMVAQMVGKAQESAKKAPRKACKAAQIAQAEPVPA